MQNFLTPKFNFLFVGKKNVERVQELGETNRPFAGICKNGAKSFLVGRTKVNNRFVHAEHIIKLHDIKIQ